MKINNSEPKNLIVQQLPAKKKENKTEINHKRNRYIIITLTSVDVQEIVKIGGKVLQTYESVICRENSRLSPFWNVIDKLFALRQKYKAKINDVMRLLVKLILIIL